MIRSTAYSLFFAALALAVGASSARAQVADTVLYEIAFPNAAHHEAEVTATFGGLSVGETLELRMSRSSPGRYAGAFVVSGFAVLALLLACIGLNGVVSYAVARRAREVGIRLSRGAESREVVWMLTGSGMRLVVAGGVVGLLVSALIAQLLSRLLHGVGALDPVTFVGVPLLLGAVAFAAAWVPARRASRVDPVTALCSD